MANIEDDDPFALVFHAIDKMQELALPLLLGASVVGFHRLCCPLNPFCSHFIAGRLSFQ